MDPIVYLYIYILVEVGKGSSYPSRKWTFSGNSAFSAFITVRNNVERLVMYEALRVQMMGKNANI